MTDLAIGVDVSKDTLDVHLHPAGDHSQFANTPKGFKAILKWPVARLVFKATGPYHRALERAMGGGRPTTVQGQSAPSQAFR
tara:strand:+ start:25160 stop:25405 length:246 start_codon:yes stop_codon:yes gene_type:complete